MKINKTLLFTLLFYIVYGIILLIQRMPINIYIPITLAEAVPFQIEWLSISLGKMSELFLLAPVSGIIVLFLYNELKKPSSTTTKSDIYMKILLMVFLASFFSGIGFHFAANLAENISGAVVNPSNKDLLIYFIDEIVGHKLIHIGIFGIFVSLLWINYARPQEPIPTYDIGLNAVPAVIVSIIFTFAQIEGQAAFDFLIINIIFVIIVTVMFLKKKINARRQQLYVFELAFCATQIPFTIIWWIITGILLGFQPWYPFIYQTHFFY